MALWQITKNYFQQSEPWWVRDLAHEMKNDEKSHTRLITQEAAQLGLIIPILPILYYTHDSIEKICRYHHKI